MCHDWTPCNLPLWPISKVKHLADVKLVRKHILVSAAMAASSNMASDAQKLGYQVSDQDAQGFLQQYPLNVIQQ